ncbi:hypothetical protein B0H13DRAFT_1920627 [Mycena leptocephala]|nr:hypothetical protein B0H13DRAFT_1920627 [Mycena leptocephala]
MPLPSYHTIILSLPPPPFQLVLPLPLLPACCLASLQYDIAWNSAVWCAGDSSLSTKAVKLPLPSLHWLTFDRFSTLLPPPPAIFGVRRPPSTFHGALHYGSHRDFVLSSSVGSDLDRRFDHIGYVAHACRKLVANDYVMRAHATSGRTTGELGGARIANSYVFSTTTWCS